MAEDVLAEARRGLPTPDRLEYTRRAFRLIPDINQPIILDIGCGSGVPTIELAGLCNGKVIGLDIDAGALEELQKRAVELGISDRVRTVRSSMLEMDFPDEQFDIVWSEGATWPIGFSKALGDWRRLLKPRGYMVIHDACWLEPDPPAEIRDFCDVNFPGISTHQENLNSIPQQGYELVGQFKLPPKAWLETYFQPLMNRLPALRRRYAGDSDALAALKREEIQTDLYVRHLRWYGSAFYIMRKKG
jgi:ubiquinone/menaquinone biosynthesis C-methylase UbiE